MLKEGELAKWVGIIIFLKEDVIPVWLILSYLKKKEKELRPSYVFYCTVKLEFFFSLSPIFQSQNLQDWRHTNYIPQTIGSLFPFSKL